MYCLVVTDDYSRFTWVFFLSTKDETRRILKSFITGIENLVDHKIKVIRCDNETEFKNREMNQFCKMKEAVNTACYVQNRVLVVTPHNKTPYELFHGKFDGKADEGFFVGYTLNGKPFRVFNSRTRIVEENLYIRFSESTPNVIGSGPDWLFDIDALTRTTNYEPILIGTQSNYYAGTKASDNTSQARKETEPNKDYILLPLWTADPPFSQDPKSSHDDGSKPSSNDGKKVDEDPRKENECNDQEKEDNVNSTNNANIVSSTVNTAGTNKDNKLPFDPNIPTLEDVSIFNFSSNDKDDDHPLDQVIEDLQSATKTRKMTKNFEEHRIEAIRLFLAYALFKDFVVYQMDVKSAFIYGKIKQEVYVCQAPGFEDPDFLNRVYKVEKALYGQHQAPRAWYETLSTYLLDNGFQRGKINKTLFIKRHKGDILLVQIYVDDIIFGSTKKELLKQKKDGIFISQDKYFFEILKKFKFTEVKTTSIPMETQKPVLKDEDVYACSRYQFNLKVSHLHAVKRVFWYLKGQPKLGLLYPKDFSFDLVAYTDNDYAGASLDRKSTTGAEYVAASSCHGQVLWIQNQLLDYGKSKRKDTQVSQPSGPTESVANEAVYNKLGDRLVRAATIASSLEAEHDIVSGSKCQETIRDTTAQTRFESVFKHSNDSLLASGNTLQSDEDRLELNELMALCTNLQTRVLELKKTKTTQQNEIDNLKRKVKKLEKRNRSRTHKLKRLYKERRIDDIDQDEDITLVNVQDDAKMFDVNDLVGEEVFVTEQAVVKDVNENVVEEVVNAAQDSTATTTITIEEITLAQAVKALKTSKPKVKGIVTCKSKTTATIPKQQSQDKGKGIMIEKLVKPKKKYQIRLHEEAAKRAFRRVNTFEDFRPELVERKEKRAGKEVIQESTNKKKVEDDKETSKLKQLMEIIQDKKEVAIDAIHLAVKSPRIVD
nr:hypothetical protein [Tanacetum cinerariifolium]